MDNEKKYTERDLILAKRKAYVAALLGADLRTTPETAKVRAAVVYPLPKITRPSVIKILSCEYKIEHGILWSRWPNSCFDAWTIVCDAETFSAICELIQNPTEEIEDDGETL